MSKNIELKNVAPRPHTIIPVPESGIVVLRGANGTGKSNALEAIDSAVTGLGRPVTNDGAVACEVSAFGVTVHLGRRLTRLGELEVTGLEGFSIADIVDPKLQDPKAADAKRIKALLRLTNAQATPAQFYSLVGSQEQFEAIVAQATLETTDPVTMAAGIKRDIEKQARVHEQAATKKAAEAEAARLAAGDIDLTVECDEEKLAQAYEAATSEHSRLQAQAAAYATALVKQAQAQKALEDAGLGNSGPTVEEAELQVASATKDLETADAEVTRLKDLLAQAQLVATEAKGVYQQANAALYAAKQNASLVEQWQGTITQALPPKVEQADVDIAEAAKDRARQAATQGTLIRKAKADMATANTLKKQALDEKSEAERLRNAARSTENVLAAAVESLGVPLTVQDSRLVVTQTDRAAGVELFDDLSEGEKWSLIGEIGANAVGEGGIIMMPQQGWQDLDQVNRRILDDVVRDKKVIIVTAEADSNYGELTPTVYDPYELKE